MKKLLILCLMLITAICLPRNIAFAEDNLQVRVIYSVAHAYSTDDINTSTVIATFEYNDVLTVVSSSVGTDGFEYYLVELSNVDGYTQGYVFKSQVLDATITSPEKRLDSNATVASDCDTYTLDGKNFVKTTTRLTAGTKIKILSGYNTSNEYTQIQYESQEQKIVTAYIKTNAIQVSGVSRTLIGAIMIIITTVSLVLIIFGIGKKKKPQKNKR